MALMPNISWVISAIYCRCLLILQKLSSLHTGKHSMKSYINCWVCKCRSTDSIQQSFIQKYCKFWTKHQLSFTRSSTETFSSPNYHQSLWHEFQGYIYCIMNSTPSPLKLICYFLFTIWFQLLTYIYTHSWHVYNTASTTEIFSEKIMSTHENEGQLWISVLQQ